MYAIRDLNVQIRRSSMPKVWNRVNHMQDKMFHDRSLETIVIQQVGLCDRVYMLSTYMCKEWHAGFRHNIFAYLIATLCPSLRLKIFYAKLFSQFASIAKRVLGEIYRF